MYFIALHESGVTEWKKERAMSEEKQKKWPNEPMSLWLHDGSHIRLERDANGDLGAAGQAIVDAELRWRKENPPETSGFTRAQELRQSENNNLKQKQFIIGEGLPRNRLEMNEYLAQVKRTRDRLESDSAQPEIEEG